MYSLITKGLKRTKLGVTCKLNLKLAALQKELFLQLNCEEIVLLSFYN